MTLKNKNDSNNNFVIGDRVKCVKDNGAFTKGDKVVVFGMDRKKGKLTFYSFFNDFVEGVMDCFVKDDKNT